MAAVAPVVSDLVDFLNASPTAFHAVVDSVRFLFASGPDEAKRRLKAAGFAQLSEREEWSGLEPGRKYFFTRNHSTIVAFAIGGKYVAGNGFHVIGAHTDSPCLKLKPVSKVTKGGYLEVGVQTYGGGLWYTWFDRDLTIAGRLIAKEANCEPDEICDFELQLCDTQPSAVAGAMKEFIFSGRLDNLCMSFCSLKALIDSTSAEQSLDHESGVRMVALFDHEEVGSDSAQGAGSPAMLDALSRITGSFNSSNSKLLEKAIQRSFLVSADMAHALHPNYMDKHEENHQPKLHGGLVIKHNANQRYATNAVTAFIFREFAERHQLPVQDFVVRNDMGCGSTIGPILASGVGIRTVDIGAPQLSMHSIREMCATDDISHAYEHFKAYFEEFTELDSKVKVDY
ncbi:Aspartyl aminopeptidase, putative [Panicum miliaceum]|uniref:Aspartyl aminopeptidase, putative n=1 Tax=Panicum miliaceum TaxID=4540 RepID=A0A3L6T2L2_PANMI|nr:Aspartyl aminopeptidase, putative [Panicum miliaceum]